MLETPLAADQISHWKELVSRELCADEKTYERFLARVEQGGLTRDENPESHFCVYFLPYNPNTKEVFIVHHKKAQLWLSPGGHLDKDETPVQALNREIEEELGIKDFFTQSPEPFFFSIVDIDHQRRSCRTHHDLWYLVPTDGSKFQVDPAEFLDAKWMTIAAARKIVTDPSNLNALERIQKI